MSERERIKQAMDRLPEYKLAYIANLILSMERYYLNHKETISFYNLLLFTAEYLYDNQT